MRLTRFRMFLLLGGALLMLGPAIGLSQPGNFGPPGGSDGSPGGPPGGDQGRRGRFRMDPNMLFNMMAPNSDFLTETQYLANPFVSRDPKAKDRIEEFMQRKGITNGGLTREQFAEYVQERMTQRQAERAAARGENGQNPTDPNAPPGAASDAPADDGEPPPPEDKRPVVYRVGNLPEGLPTWFASMDSDRDGQVGLYEWKAQGRPVADFQKIDLNGDGFITIDEALRYQKTQSATAAAANGPSTPGVTTFGGQPSFNGQSGAGFNNRFGNRRNRRSNQGPPNSDN